MLSYIIPTRNRPESLGRTLERLGALSAAAHETLGGAEVIVVDDCSDEPLRESRSLLNGFPVRIQRTPRMMGAAARNLGVEAARGEWIVMLDDDSWPAHERLVEVIANAEADVAAIGGEILLSGKREDGGLPEVFVGCGAVLRRSAFLNVGGYDETFHYYAEEYDLCARLIRAGWHVEHDFRMRFHHAKVARGRDMNAILCRLVRNNGWVAARYAPEVQRCAEIERVIRRCAFIAAREDARFGFEQGLDELLETIDAQPQRQMTSEEWERFIGRSAVERDLIPDLRVGARITLVKHGRNDWVVRDVLCEMECEMADDHADADVLVIGTLSPGPMLDALDAMGNELRPVILPWRPKETAEKWFEAIGKRQ